MKLLSRDFTTKEKALLAFLCLILLGFLYYFAVDKPVRTTIATCEAEQADLQTELQAVQLRLAQLQTMAAELENDGSLESTMPSYNNIRGELAFLNGVMEAADTYSLSFADVTRDGDQIRRDVSMQFTAGSYEDAREILTTLRSSEDRCLLQDLRISAGRDAENLSDGGVSVSLTMTFYETMVGGTPDEGLPVEEKTADTVEEEE